MFICVLTDCVLTSVCGDCEWMNVWVKGVERKSQKRGEASYQLLNMTFPGWAFGPQQGRHLCACLSSPSAPQARWLNYLQQGTGPRDSQHSLLQPAKASPSWAPVAWGLKPEAQAPSCSVYPSLGPVWSSAHSPSVHTPVTFSPRRKDHAGFTPLSCSCWN